MIEHSDVVVIGGGLSGLALGKRLAQRGYRGRVSIVEPRTGYEDDRSWGFWTPSGSEWEKAAARTWKHWSFSRQGGATVSQRAEGWCYAYVRSVDFYRDALRAISASANIKLLLGTRATAIAATGDGFAVTTSEGTLTARHVIDTRPPSPDRWLGSALFQSFMGRELRLHQPVFDDQAIELMTDMHCDARGFVFTYVLPLSPNRALVEVTRFARQPASAADLSLDLDALLEARGCSRGEVLRSESAVLPMGLPPAAKTQTPLGVTRAGTGAGALRAASGYGFLRIHAWADRCAEALMRGWPPTSHPAEPPLRRWMDQLFLRVLAAEPERSPEFFHRLLATVPGPAFVRFMSDQARWADHARIIAALPPGPFLQALQRAPRLGRLPA